MKNRLLTENLLFPLPNASQSEIMETFLEMKDCRIERIVSQGQSSPGGFWHDQSHDEWVLILQGSALLRYEDGSERAMAVGDAELIPARKRHRVEWTDSQEKTVWLAIHGTIVSENRL